MKGIPSGSTSGLMPHLALKWGEKNVTMMTLLQVAVTHLVCAVQCSASAPLNCVRCGILELMTCASKLNKDVNTIL